jgi:hypothetical protein
VYHLSYLNVATNQQKVDFVAVQTLAVFNGSVDSIQLAMATAFNSNLTPE